MDSSQSRYTNIAFISYKREDEQWAKWLQKKLEHYKLPTEIREQNPNLEFAKNPRHVFKDTTDLSGGVLAKAIKEGLDSSKFLIVICSPRAAKSEWVCKEVQDFIDSGREEFIIPFIIDGEPYAKDLKNECFPEALKTLAGERELLDININENGRESAAVKVVAKMFSLRFDSLWNRFQREEKIKRRAIFGSVVIFSIAVLMIAIWIEKQNIELDRRNKRIEQQNVQLDLQRNSISAQNDSLKEAYNKLDISTKSLAETNLELERRNIQLKEEKEKVLRVNWKMMENRARTVSATARELLAKGNVITAITLLQDIIPDGSNNLPFVLESEQTLRAAYDSLFYSKGPIWTMIGHEGVQTEAIFSPDSKYVLTASNDKTVRIWDAKTGEEQTGLRMNHNEAIHHVAYRPNGNEILTSGYNNNVVRWIIKDGRCYNMGIILHGVVPSYSYDGKYIIVENKKDVKVYSADNFKQLFTDETNCSKFVFSHFSDFYAVLSPQKNITIKTVDGDVLKNISGKEMADDYVYQIMFSFDDKKIIAQTKRAIYIWDLHSNNKRIIKDIDIEGAECTQDNKYIVTRTSDYGNVKFWDINSCKEIDSLRLYYSEHPFVRNASISPNGQYLLTSTFDGKTRLYRNPLLPLPERVEQLLHQDAYVHFDASGKGVDMNYDGQYTHLQHHNLSSNICFSFEEKDNGSRMTSSSRNGLLAILYWGSKDYIDVFDTNKISTYRTIRVSSKSVINDMCISPSGRLLAVAYNNGKTLLYEINTGALVNTLIGHSNGVVSCRFDNNESRIVTASYDHTVRIWDVSSGKELSKTLFLTEVTYASISDDLQLLVVSTWHGIDVIDITSSTLIYHSNLFDCTQAILDGKTLYYIIGDGFSDNTLCKLSFPSFSEILEECKRACKGRKLSSEERRKYYLD